MKDDEKRLGEGIGEQNRVTYAAKKISMPRRCRIGGNIKEIYQRADS
jgi:hypothetical protein